MPSNPGDEANDLTSLKEMVADVINEGTKVAGYRTWQEEFDRHVREGNLDLSAHYCEAMSGLQQFALVSREEWLRVRRDAARGAVEGPRRVQTDRGVRHVTDRR